MNIAKTVFLMLALRTGVASANDVTPPPPLPPIVPGAPTVPGLPGSPTIPGMPGYDPSNPAGVPPSPPALPPYLYSVSPRIAHPGDWVLINLSASDPDSPLLYYSFRGNVPGAYMNGDTFYWQATEPGHYVVTFEVSDGLWTDDETTSITVVEP